jgi:hypothetical protein
MTRAGCLNQLAAVKAAQFACGTTGSWDLITWKVLRNSSPALANVAFEKAVGCYHQRHVSRKATVTLPFTPSNRENRLR